ncbi:hypothetical protein BKA69DRAFT_1086360 [Paraphysoderma sedebokerense]|nr:hypothetical protein BKA69DRAFT_1086360 [Paraphysoderma sedebokerense]
MSSVFKNPRVSPLLWHPSLIVGVFYDPSVTGHTGQSGYSMLKYSYTAGSMYNSATSSGSSSATSALGFQFYCQNVNNMCLWTSSTGFDEYAMNSFGLVQSKVVTTTPIDYDPSIARNASDGVSYFFHRSVNLAGRPFVLHKKNTAVQELASVTLPYQTNFNDTIPRNVVRIGSKSNVFVGFTTILNSSISYGDYEAVFCHYDSVTMDLRGHVIISTVGKDNFAGIIPQNDNSFVTIGRTNGNLTLPNALSSSPQIFAMQFVPLKVKSFISSVPMQVHPNEVIQVQFESVSTTLGATLPRVALNGLNSSSVSWASSDTISAEIPGNIIGSGPYDMWVVFDSARYKPSLKIAGITVNYTVSQFSLISVYPASGPTVGFDLVLRTSFVGTIPGPLAITVGGKSCGAPLQLNTTAFQCSVPPGTGKNKLVFISVSSNMSSTESVYVNYDPPIITTISPPTSPTTGGKVIYIFGSGFGPCLVAPAPCDATAENISISIGSVACALPELKSDGSIACVTPELVGRNLSLRLGVNGQNTSAIYSYDPPSISTVIPPWLSSSNPVGLSFLTFLL